MDLSWNSLEAKHMEGRKMRGRGGWNGEGGTGMFPLAFYECPGSGPEEAAVCRWQMMPGLFLAKCLGELSLRGSGMEKQQENKTKLVLPAFRDFQKLGEEGRSDGGREIATW